MSALYQCAVHLHSDTHKPFPLVCCRSLLRELRALSLISTFLLLRQEVMGYGLPRLSLLLSVLVPRLSLMLSVRVPRLFFSWGCEAKLKLVRWERRGRWGWVGGG